MKMIEKGHRHQNVHNPAYTLWLNRTPKTCEANIVLELQNHYEPFLFCDAIILLIVTVLCLCQLYFIN